MTSYILPVIVTGIFFYAAVKKINVFETFMNGALENIKTSFDILPALVILMTCIGVLNTSGAVNAITEFISPAVEILGFPPQCIPLALLRPMSGSGALAAFESVLSQNGADSFVGRVASVIMGSTETTFYTVAVYYGATKTKNIRHTIVCALAADVTGFIVACTAVRLFL